MIQALPRSTLAALLFAGIALAAGCGSGSGDINDCNDGIDNDTDGFIDGADPGCAINLTAESPDPNPADCADGIDNDQDGLIDFPTDPGCSSSRDNSEDNVFASQCSDGIDNDGDGFIDYPNDPGCVLLQADDEEDQCPAGERCPQCSNGVDDDGDGLTDYPEEPGCDNAADNDEYNSTATNCGSFVPVMELPPDGNATSMIRDSGPGELTSRECGGTGMEVVYTLEVSAPTALVITTDFPQTTLDTVVYVRSACRSTASELGCSDDVGGSLGSTLALVVEPGMYFIVVDAHHPSAIGNYRLSVSSYTAPGQPCDVNAPTCSPDYVCRPIDTNTTETTCELPSCMDGIDNEGDGLPDFPDDPGCTEPEDNDETDDCPGGGLCPSCGNGVDDDGDGLIDYMGMDPGCASASDTSEIDQCLPGLEVEFLPAGGASGTLPNGTSSLSGSCGGDFSPEAVYVYPLDRDLVSLTFSTVGSVMNTVTYVRSGDCDGGPELGCANGFPGGEAVTLQSPTQGDYFVIVDGDFNVGSYVLDVSGVIPGGDSCAPGDPRFVCEPGYGCEVATCVPTVCNNGIDDDGDMLIDFPNDPGCAAVSDNTEADDCPDGATCPACGNGMDDDGDGLIDFVGMDPGCDSAADSSEIDHCVPGLQVGSLEPGGASGTTGSGSGLISGSCGGAFSDEAVYAYQLTRPLVSLSFSTVGSSMDVVTYVRFGDCEIGAEVACGNAFPGGEEVTVANPALGTYFAIVDGDFDFGSYVLDVRGVIPGGDACDPADLGFVCEPGYSCAGNVCAPAACNNGIDDDGDMLGDYPNDPGCTSVSDGDESDDCPAGPMCPACGNAQDDDGDGINDYPVDPGCSSASDPDENDCMDSDPVVPIMAGTTTGTTIGAVHDFTPSCSIGSTAPERAFTLTVPGNLSSLTVDTFGSSYDTMLYIKSDNCGSPDLACNDDSVGLQSQIMLINAVAGTYFIFVDGFSSSSGSFTLNVTGVIGAGQACDPTQIQSGILSCASGTTCTSTGSSSICQ